MPRQLTDIEKFFIENNAGVMTATEIADKIPGYGAKTIQSYIDENVEFNDYSEAEVPERVSKTKSFELTEAEEYFIENKYRQGVRFDQIVSALPNVDESIIKSFISTLKDVVGDLFKRTTVEGNMQNPGVTIMTPAASLHNDIAKAANPPQNKSLSPERIHTIHPGRPRR